MQTIDNLCQITVRETAGLDRTNDPVRTGLPFPKGVVTDPNALHLKKQDGQCLNFQAKTLEFWPDKSVKWALFDFMVSVPANTEMTLNLSTALAKQSETTNRKAKISIKEQSGSLLINTSPTLFKLSNHGQCLDSVSFAGSELIESSIPQLTLQDVKGNKLTVKQSRPKIEESGPLHCSVLTTGTFNDNKGKFFANFTIRYSFWAGLSTVKVEFTLHNPKAALHAGGLWDLGDKGSIFFKDLSLKIGLTGEKPAVAWQVEPGQKTCYEPCDRFVLHQNSSGGKNCDSPNHLNCNNEKTVSFSGYRVTATSRDQTKIYAEGQRATPWVKLSTTTGWIAGSTQDFWQNFPKSIKTANNAINISLFPEEQKHNFELQGGEKKRHTIFLDFGTTISETNIKNYLQPVEVSVSPEWLEKAEAIPYLSAPGEHDSLKYQDYIQHIIEGKNSFFNKREIIDEYGWRNFGEQYADHEAVNHTGNAPFISHYNNQYDFILGAATHFFRSEDQRWRNLMVQQAKHLIDIDIYNTSEDKQSYNHGLFWHTDHYQEAGTCTHRTYSKKALAGLSSKNAYGGGPSNEHNYSSGLLHYYYLTGDCEAQKTVIGLANWVISMDNGSKTIFGIIDEGATGLASQTVDVAYHKAGRGAGNCINTLIDAYRLTGKQRYMAKAEELLTRCIHPEDNIDALDLTEPELRWSYLVFLQSIGKYLDYKAELGEIDYHFHYARESLLHYATWMKEYEVPYKDVLHKVDIPTETWPAHDIRKCHIFFLAAKYCRKQDEEEYRQKAIFFFQRGLDDLLSFETAHLTRPLVIMAVYGQVYSYFMKKNCQFTVPPHNYNFGSPTDFIPQRARLKTTLRFKAKIVANFIKATVSAKLRKP